MKTLSIVSGLMLICLTVLLAGCGKRLEVRPVVVTETVIEKVQVPAELLEPCPEPGLDAIKTTGDLERVAVEALGSLSLCNQDKVRIREWQEAD